MEFSFVGALPTSGQTGEDAPSASLKYYIELLLVFDLAPSLLAVGADTKPKPVEPKADVGLPLLAALLNAPKPKPLEGLEAAPPKAGDGEVVAEVDPNAED